MKPETARRRLNLAVQSGALVRPETCERCGVAPGPASDGRAGIQGHHHDYSKPLDVEWICAKCHRAETPLPETMGAPTPGERNGQSKLTQHQVAAIRASALGCRRLAKEYGVDKTTIQRARNGTHWLAAAPVAPDREG